MVHSQNGLFSKGPLLKWVFSKLSVLKMGSFRNLPFKTGCPQKVIFSKSYILKKVWLGNKRSLGEK